MVDNDPTRYPADLLYRWKSTAELEALERIGKTASERGKECEVVDKWVNTAYAEKSGIVKEIQEQGYELRWTSAKKENERVDLEGWEPVLINQPDGNRACLKVKDHSAIGGYLILLKKRKP
ncbi:MAG: hypothetical protein ACLQVJ_07070 [Syntrophobacteraceae bacterium]